MPRLGEIPATTPIGQPIGAVTDYAGASDPPDGEWLICDGREVSRSGYPSLFALLGTTFGIGNGSTTFNLPDCRGKGTIGAGSGPGLTARARGASGGEETHDLQTTELPSHDHPATASTSIAAGGSHAHSVTVEDGRSNMGVQGGGVTVHFHFARSLTTSTAAAHGHSASTTVDVLPAGGGLPHNNMPPFLVLNKIIKVL